MRSNNSFKPNLLRSSEVGLIQVLGRTAAMSQPVYLKGIGGWLTFLVVGLCLLHPLFGAYQGVQNFTAAESNPTSFASLAAWASYKQAAWALFAVVSALRILAGASLLLSRQRSAVLFTVAVMWLCPLLSAAGDCLLLFRYFGQALSTTAAESMRQLLVAWFWAAVWSGYLFKSVRVRNTYGVRPNNSFKPKPLRGSA
jgi:hypothetical protein